MKVFGGNASLTLAQDLSKILCVENVPVEEHVFPDGERRIRIPENVVDEHAIVIQSACPPVDSNYMELFFLIDSLKRSGAEKITTVVPYFGYQRQDHVFRDGEAVSLEVIIRILESLKIDTLVSVDMHSVRIPDLFTIPVRHVSAIELFAREIQKRNWHDSNTVLISPDQGGIARVKKLSEELSGMDFAALEKNRDLITGVLTINAIADGSLRGKKRAIIVDDMISSGQTLLAGANFLKKQGIEEIIVFATHAIFSEDAPRALQNSVTQSVYVTDTVVVPKEKQFEKLHTLSITPILAQAIQG